MVDFGPQPRGRAQILAFGCALYRMGEYSQLVRHHPPTGGPPQYNAGSEGSRDKRNGIVEVVWRNEVEWER